MNLVNKQLKRESESKMTSWVAYKEFLVFCKERMYVAEEKIQDLIFRATEIQR